jgi:hypothetical protein
VIANEIHIRSGQQGDETAKESQRFEYYFGLAVRLWPWFLQPVTDIAVRVKREPVYGERSAKTVSAKPFKPFAIMFCDSPCSVEGETVYLCTERLCILIVMSVM